MELFVKMINGFILLTIFTKSFILDVWQGSDYAYEDFYSELLKILFIAVD